MKLMHVLVWAAFPAMPSWAANVTLILDGVMQEGPYVLTNLGVTAVGDVTVSVSKTPTVPTETGGQSSTLTVTQSAGGMISASPNQTSFSCSTDATSGAVTCPSVVLSAVPSPSTGATAYAFNAWSGDCASGSLAASGAVVVGATCTLNMSASHKVSAIFTATPVTPPVVDSCTPTGMTLVEVASNIPISTLIKKDYASTTKTVTAFSFKTPVASTTLKMGGATATQLSNTEGGKMIVVSTCKGDISTAGKDSGCYRYAGESTFIEYLTNYKVYRPDTYCNLQPNTQYYFNVVPRDGTTQGASETSTCSKDSACGFSFNAY